MGTRFRRWLTQLREFNAGLDELYERQALLNRPWEEEFVHWAYDGGEWRLHGHLPAPNDGRRRSVTRNGWCPGCS